MGRADPSHLVVGHLQRPHGIRGEVFVFPLTDHPESVFAPGVVLLLGEEHENEPNPDLPPLRVDSVRPFQKGILVCFGGVYGRDEAGSLRGRYLFQEIDQLIPLTEDEVYYHQLLNMTVVTVAGEEVGSVVEVYELSPADLLEVHGGRGILMIPYQEHIVVDVDMEGGRIAIDPPAGLLDL